MMPAVDTSDRPFGLPADIDFTVPGNAVPWARAGGRGKIRFTPAKQRSYAGVLKLYCSRAMNGSGRIDGPVCLTVTAVYAWPKSLSQKKKQLPTTVWKTSRPDADNLTKIVKDALNTIAWRDDSQVAASHTYKRFGEVPCLRVQIERLG